MLRYIHALNSEGQVRTDIIKKVDEDLISFVPCDIENKDYQEYQTWEAIDGNDIETPEPEEP